MISYILGRRQTNFSWTLGLFIETAGNHLESSRAFLREGEKGTRWTLGSKCKLLQLNQLTGMEIQPSGV